MNRLQQLFHGSRNDDRPDCYKRVRYIRDSCKVFSDLCKNEKDFFNRGIDGDLSKSFKEFRQSEVAKDYRTVDSNGKYSSTSILNELIDEIIEIHEFIDVRRRTSTEQIKKLIELARDKQSTIRQTMNDLRDNYEKAERKLEIADSNLKKFQTRPDRLVINNYNERCRELEEIRFECELNRTLTRDQYQAEIYQYANEEYSITTDIFSRYLFEQSLFYQDISNYFSSKMPRIESRLNDNDFIPIFGCDLIRHCSKRPSTKIAYPIEICVRLIENHLKEEGIFRIASSQSKQKKFVHELNLQLIDKSQKLEELGYDAHVPANTLKQYLRELPSCLLTNELYPQWNQLIHLSEQVRLQRVEQILQKMPDIHYENLCYLVRFLVRLSKYSNENKMNVNNLSICIGSTILFSKDQQQTSSINPTSISTNYTNGSIILELLITNYESLFGSSSKISRSSINSSERNIEIPPDLIPTEFHSVRTNPLNETLNESQSNQIQPSPVTRRKAKAPPPPPINSFSIVETKQVFDQEKYSPIDENNSIDYNSQSQGISSINVHLNSNEKIHRRTIGHQTGFDRPTDPPPLPPSQSTKLYENLSFSLDEQKQTKSDENLDQQYKTQHEELDKSTSNVSNESISVGKVIAQFNNRTSILNNSTGKFRGNEFQSNNRSSNSSNSSFGPMINDSTTETTDF